MLVRAQHAQRKGSGVSLDPPDALSSVLRQHRRGMGPAEAQLTHDREGVDLAHEPHPPMLGSLLGPLDSAFRCSSRAWCNGCTRAFQALSTGSIPVARFTHGNVRRHVTARPPVRLSAMNRQQRLGQLMELRGVDAVVLRRPANFAWFTGGADSKVDHVAPEGVADLIVRADSQVVLTSTIEAARMRAEQTRAVDVVEYPWHEDRDAALRDLLGDARAGSDLGLAGTMDLSDEIARLRWTLDSDAVESLRLVGRDATAAMADAAATIEAGMTEHEAAAALAAACRRRGLTATVL